ncbi:hypothetical protein [Peribacillus sp. NPDC097895]|uniref:hypothetical protein n=1 Tax=Peribacillus sp. NPDC097895 TaxID=3390619 RepID=UPI003D07E69D
MKWALKNKKNYSPSLALSIDETPYELEKGYKLERLITNLTFPTSVAFDNQGHIYFAAAGFAYGTEPEEGRILKVKEAGTFSVYVAGLDGPVTGMTCPQGELFIAEGN